VPDGEEGVMTQRRWEPDPVLVGTDGSQESTQAVRWAAREAVLRGSGLHVVHSWLWPMFHVPLGGSPLAPPDSGLEAEAHRVLEQARSTAHAVGGDRLVVETTLAVGEARTELLRRATGSCLVVVGNRGLGGFTGLLLGSTGIALSAHSPRPVVVVRGTSTPDGPVAVGLDGALEADAVLRRALAEARLRRTSLHVVHAWSLGLGSAAHTYAEALERGRVAGQELVDKALARLSDSTDVTVTVQLGDRSPAAELVAASQEAQLLVVGSRDLGSLRGMLLGSTTHAVLHHAACPVLVDR
jgi:nucleotide-binding universal stress UspA family protein